jgi:predicted ABC-type ATPase
MQKIKRLRIFAGPNGSGKTTLYKEVKLHFNQLPFINADEIEFSLSKSGLIDLQLFGITATTLDLEKFSKTTDAKSLISKAEIEGYKIIIEIAENCIVDKSIKMHSYAASFVASFIRWLLFSKNKSFSFETVMSHRSKLKEIKSSKKNGYKVYLYFVCTDLPEINIERVKDRIGKGGHKVNFEKISSRYISTLANLFPAIKLSDRVFLFDNSGKKHELIGEISSGLLQIKTDKLPNWFIQHVLKFYN